MPQVQIPDFVGQNEERARGYQNAMLNKSRLKSAGIEQGEQQRSISKRNELEQLMLRTPEPDRDRAGLEWAKVNNPDLYARLTAMHVNKLQQGLAVNPEQAAAAFERNTGEKLQFDPMRGVHLVDMQDGSKVAISARGVEHFKSDVPKPFVVSPGSAAFQPGQTEPFYTAPFAPKTESTAGTAQTEIVGNRVMQFNTKTQRYDIDVGPAPPKSSLSMGLGMPQFVGIQDGQAAIYQPQRGGAGKMATVPLPGQGPLISRTEGFDEGRAVINAKSGLRAAAAVRAMLADKNILAQAAIPGSPGARKFAAARKEMIDVLTRLRTGAALNREEEDFYAGQAPTVLDLTDTETIEYKIKLFEDLYNGIVNRRTAGGGGAAPANPQADSLRQKYNY